MALDFQFLSLKKDSRNRHYNAEIIVDNRKGKYEIYTDAKFYFYDWLDNSLSILDGEDRAFSGELPYLCIKSLDTGNKENESKLKKAILDFIKKECCEKCGN
jgi:hypothetical protein